MYVQPHFRAVIAPILLAALLVAPGSHASEGEDWDLARSGEGIEIYTRPIAGSSIKAFRGEAILPADLNRVMALMDDIAACPDWMYRCEAPVLLERIDLAQRYTYMRNRLPWPARDRALIVHSRIEQDPDTRTVVVTLRGVAEEDLPETARERLPDFRDLTRVGKLRGSWTFHPQDADRTRAVYEMHAEIGGKLPAPLVNSLIVDTPYETLSRMREVVQREKYRCFRPF